MRISIVLPIHNEERYLAACLDSILAQTHADWELLAVDDGSTDATPQILAAYAARDARICPITTPNRRVVAALRTAYSASSGALVTRMDADDQMAPHKLERKHALLERFGPGHLAVGLVEYFSDEGLGDGYRRYGEWINAVNRAGNAWRELYRDCPIPAPNWLVYRSDLDRCGAFDSDAVPEDYDLVFRFRRAGLVPVVATEVLLRWRDHPRRTTRRVAEYDLARYFDVKLPWFLELDRDAGRPLVLWGAGPKGKRLARQLIDRGLSFRWLSDNPNKCGQDIYGVVLESSSALEHIVRPQLILAVAGPADRAEISARLARDGREAGSDVFWFC